MKRYTMWCNATHKHEMMESEQGSWVLYEDIKHLLDVQSQPSTHVGTDRCGFDRNGSHSNGYYVCMCGWPDEVHDEGKEKP